MDTTKLEVAKAAFVQAAKEAVSIVAEAELEVRQLEGRKVSLQTEVGSLTTALAPARAEAAGQIRHMQDAYAKSRTARIEQEQVENKLKAVLVDYAKQEASAKARAEKEYDRVKAELDAKLRQIEKKIEQKNEEYNAFIAKFVKG